MTFKREFLLRTTTYRIFLYLVTVADNKQGDLTASEKKDQLQAELDTTEHSSHAKEKISKLEEDLQSIKQKEMTFLTDQLEQLQRELEMLKQKGKTKVNVANSHDY